MNPVALTEQPSQVVAHIGVVVRQHDQLTASVQFRGARGRARGLLGTVHLGPCNDLLIGFRQPSECLLNVAIRTNGAGGKTTCRFNPLRREMVLTLGNNHRECAADTFFARYRDRPTMESHQFLDQGESYSRAFVGTPAGSLNAVEAFEQVRQLMFSNTNAGISDLQLNGIPDGLQVHRYPACESELKSVGQKIEYNLLPHIAININWLGNGRALHIKLQSRTLHS